LPARFGGGATAGRKGIEILYGVIFTIRAFERSEAVDPVYDRRREILLEGYNLYLRPGSYRWISSASSQRMIFVETFRMDHPPLPGNRPIENGRSGRKK
jgi:hypothetical protein